MMKIQTLLFALLLQQAGASSFLRSLRRLSEEYFLSYEPVTTVTDHAAIDLDQRAIETQLALGTDQGRQAALAVYSQGAFSKSYAEVTLASGLQVDVAKDTTVMGATADGKQVRASTMADTKAGDTVLLLQYHASPVQASWTDCHVGGNPEPNTNGCFAPTGSIEVGELGTYTYSYAPLESNFNGRTIQGFSTQAKEKMLDCPGCPYATYEKFFKYYGVEDYANQWILAALNKGPTSFAKGDANFGSYTSDGIAESAKKGTAYMAIWMYVIREMEDAIDDCNADCSTGQCNDDQVHAWDEAVAFYTGSIPKTSGDGGHLLYTLAQKRCENYGTCLTTGAETGMASVNSEIFKNFRIGKQNLLMGNCEVVRQNVARITQLMTVPLIQGTIRYAYVMDKQNDTREKAEAEGAVFAAAVLPIVNACDEADADIIYDNMKVGNGGSASFEVVKDAFERNYGCLGITCSDVGGLVDVVTNGYLEGAEPCGYNPEKPSSSSSSSATTATTTTTNAQKSNGGDDGPNVGLAVGLSIGIVVSLLVVALLVSRKGNQKEFDGMAEPEMT